MAETVSIACKLPNGIVLELPGHPRVYIKGSAVEIGLPSERRTTQDLSVPPLLVPGGFALTPDVDADFWRAWSTAYAGMEVLQKGLLFAMPKPQDARAKAREMAKEKTGLEPIDPDKMGDGLERVSAAA